MELSEQPGLVALVHELNEKLETLVPFWFRAFETFDKAEAIAFATLVEMSIDILVRFIDEQTAAGAAA